MDSRALHEPAQWPLNGIAQLLTSLPFRHMREQVEHSVVDGPSIYSSLYTYD